MELLDEIIKQYRVLANSAATMLMEIERKIYELERLKMNETESKETIKRDVVMIPFAAYEAQLERFDEEKEKLRKHYQRIVISISSVLVIMIIGIFALVFYFFSNYDFATVSQDGDGLNNFVNRSSSVEVAYGAEDNNDQLEEPEQDSEGNLDQQEEYWNDVG